MFETPPRPVDRTISANEGMFQGNEAHYFGVGAGAVTNIKRALGAAGRNPDSVARILDLPCGHGRVLRYLKTEFPHAEITACDLLTDGVDFCASQFGAIPVYSDPDPSRIPLARDAFDLVWVGSLVTHLDAQGFSLFLAFFRDLLKRDGLLVFSTHGRQAHARIANDDCLYGLDERRRNMILREYERIGFGYADHPGQDGWGISLSEPHWVCRLITSIPELRLINVSEKSWDDHHDVFACVRDPDWQVKCTPAPDVRSTRGHNGADSLAGKTQARWKGWWKRSA